MNYKSFLPPDPTVEELKILDSLVVDLYRKFDDPLDKLIFALRYEMGYGWVDISAMTGYSQVTVMKRIRRIKDTLEDTSSIPKLKWDEASGQWVKKSPE